MISGDTLTPPLKKSAVSPLRVDEITTVSALVSLHDEWNGLLDECERPEIYLTHEWITTWWKCLGDANKELFILIIREGETLLGIAPFMIIKERCLGISMIKIQLISMMRYPDSPANCSGSLDLIIPERHGEVIGTIMSHLEQTKKIWHCIQLNPLSQKSKAMQLLTQHSRARGYAATKHYIYANAYIDVSRGWEWYHGQLSKRFKDKLKSEERQLQKKGDVTFKEFRSQEEIAGVYSNILDIEQRSWKWDIGVSINSIAFKNFYHEFAKAAGQQGWLRVWMMQLNGKNIAYDYLVEYNGQVASLKTSYDAQYQQYSPGHVLTWFEFQKLFRENVDRISLLWGNTIEKNRWAPAFEEHYELMIFNNTWYVKILRFMQQRLRLCRFHRMIRDVKNRATRKLGIHLRTSELTREDQLRNRHDSTNDN